MSSAAGPHIASERVSSANLVERQHLTGHLSTVQHGDTKAIVDLGKSCQSCGRAAYRESSWVSPNLAR